MASIELRGVDKVYEGGHRAVRRLDLRIEDGELVVLLGPSGCGKSTVLRLVAGLEELTSGEIHVGGERVEALPPQKRDVAMVFQSYALYGHMTVRQNIEFPLRMRGVSPSDRKRRVQRVAELLELGEFLDQRPASLSGGQQQRVAMGRALVREPRAFLLDEPLSNLDARLRGQVRTHIARLQERLAVTTLYVTHDQVEALSLGHRVAVLREGRLQQIDTGQNLYDQPANTFVAQFLGQPGMNLIRGRLERLNGSWVVTCGPGPLRLSLGPGLAAAGIEEQAGGDVVVGVRPESFELVAPEGADALPGTVKAVEPLGHERVIYLASDVATLDATAKSEEDSQAGDGSPLLSVRAGSGAEDSVSPGDRVGLRARAGELALFDRQGNAFLT